MTTFAEVVKLFDLDTVNPLRGEWRVLSPQDLCGMIVTTTVDVAPAPLPDRLCTVCGGTQRVAGRVSGLTVRCPACVPRVTRQLQLSTRWYDGK